MPDDPKRRRDRRIDTEDIHLEDEAAQTRPAPKPLAGEGARQPAQPPKKRSDRRAQKAITRTLRVGGATTVKGAQKAIDTFNAFTHSAEADVGQNLGLFKSIARFFSKMTFPAFLLMSALIIAVSLMAFSNSTVTVDKQVISVVGLPKELEGYTMLVMGDLHGRMFGSQQKALLRVIEGLSYNAVLFSGDMVGSSGNAQPFYDLLDGLPASRTKFFISGDSDPDPIIEKPRAEGTLQGVVLADWVLGAQARGAKYLSYTQGIAVSGQTLWFSPQNMLNVNLTETLRLLEAQIRLESAGVMSPDPIETDIINYPKTRYAYNTFKLTQEASSSMAATDIHIALTHYPPSQSFMTTVQQRGEEQTIAYLPTVDMVFSGHYCGGVWRLPGIGALYIPNSFYPRHGWFPDQRDVQGQKVLGLSTQYTTPGLGVTDRVWLPNFRLLNPPTVSQITLTAKITDNLLGD